MTISNECVTVCVPRWRVAAAHALLFAAWIFGAGDGQAVWSNIGAFLARGTKVEFKAERS